jgi:hypothetical protein
VRNSALCLEVLQAILCRLLSILAGLLCELRGLLAGLLHILQSLLRSLLRGLLTGLLRGHHHGIVLSKRRNGTKNKQEQSGFHFSFPNAGLRSLFG